MRPSLQVNNRFPQLTYDESEITRFFEFLDQHKDLNIPQGELSFNFVSNEEIAQLHNDFFQDPTETDVITFTGDPDDDYAGDICVSVPYAEESAKEYNTTLSEELSLYLIHGCLHLAGFDDIEEDDRLKMREGEKILMTSVKEAGLIPQFQFID
jgi:probable rRNA maturation factor